MPTRSIRLAALSLVFAAWVAPRPVSADEGLDAAVGTWGGTIGTTEGDVTVDAFTLKIDKKGAGYEATSRADVTVHAAGGDRKTVVLTAYQGAAKDDALSFRSTARLRSVAGGPPEVLSAATLVVKPREGHVEARLGNDAEGYTDLTLVASTKGARALAVDGIRGSWGGDMSHKSLGSGVTLDELYLEVPTEGGWSVEVRMECTVAKEEQKIPVTVLASYSGGRVDGGKVRFEKVTWKRTVVPTGQKTDLEGNPLTLTLVAADRLEGNFEGDDGYAFSLARRGAVTGPAPAPAPERPLAGMAGSWGGAFRDAKLNDQLLIREGNLDLTRDGGAWSATVRFVFVVKAEGGDVVVNAEGSYPPGHESGDAVLFPATKLTRTIVSTGATNPIDGNPLELRWEPDGRLEAKLTGDGGFTLTMARK
jgi:hypothetical protein